MSTQVENALDVAKVQQFVGKALADCATTLSATLAVIGDNLGLYKAMAGAGPLTSAQLAERTNTSERYIREWLINQASAGYIEYDAQTQHYSLPDEHAVPLIDEDSPFYVGGAFLDCRRNDTR